MAPYDPIVDPIRREILNRYAFDIQRLGLPVFDSVVANRAEERSFSDRRQYLYWLMAHPTEQEWHILMDQLAIKETYFFRNRSQFEFLESRGIPEITMQRLRDVRSGTRPVLRILSAGCATGEEPYSIAMMLLEHVQRIQSWDIIVDAWDISEQALASARRGRYASSERMINSLHARNPVLLKKYFDPVEDGAYQIRENVKNLVRFQKQNLKEIIAHTNFPGRWDIIFCRNVMIYFDHDNQARLVRWLEHSTQPRGFVMTGDVETLHVFEHELQPVRWNGLVYQRPQKTSVSCC